MFMLQVKADGEEEGEVEGEENEPLVEGGFCLGDTVSVDGLKGAAQHNGKMATACFC